MEANDSVVEEVLEFLLQGQDEDVRRHHPKIIQVIDRFSHLERPAQPTSRDAIHCKTIKSIC